MLNLLQTGTRQKRPSSLQTTKWRGVVFGWNVCALSRLLNYSPGPTSRVGALIVRSRYPLSVCVFVLVPLASMLLHAQTKKPQLQDAGRNPELDVTKLGLRSRPEVIKIIGKPDKSGPLGSDYYSWGLTGYENGKLDEVDYEFKRRANTVEDALQKVGLKLTSSPTKGPLTYFWNSSTRPLVCCGFEMDNVVISMDFSGIMVGFKRKLDSR
jgi:hypothetical protein